MVAINYVIGMIGETYLKAMTGLAILFKHYGLNFMIFTQMKLCRIAPTQLQQCF